VKADLIYQQGQPSTGLYHILSGRVELHGPQGARMCGPGETFGNEFLRGESRRVDTAFAEELDALVLDRESVMEEARMAPRTAIALLAAKWGSHG
jgi:hypothetical protein